MTSNMTSNSSKDDDTQKAWWKGALVYQVYMRSFADSNNDGIGDLPGLTDKLDYIADLGVDAIWITPIYPSPMKDFGYDVSDYTAIDPMFGTMEDFDSLIKKAKDLNIKIVMDHVWSHTSEEHPWFKASADPTHPEHEKYHDWYVWSSPEKNDPEQQPPNNWKSVFAGSAWEWNPKRESFYLHNFLKEQPDLNWHNPNVRNAIKDVAKFWLEKGISGNGFRLDACNYYTHDPELKDNPLKFPPKENDTVSEKETNFRDYHNIYNISQPQNLDYLEELREIFTNYPNAMMLGEMLMVNGDLQFVNEYMTEKRLDTIYSSFLIYPDYPTA
ncbi:MAG: alpha-glucosidase, partial [Candidatus Heimdallarchaeota archaeon]|nr:alpha-glucosidase [Candidatus Heimdallarchaeota archaeon]